MSDKADFEWISREEAEQLALLSGYYVRPAFDGVVPSYMMCTDKWFIKSDGEEVQHVDPSRPLDAVIDIKPFEDFVAFCDNMFGKSTKK